MSYTERTEMLLGKEAVEKLRSSHVAVFGLGGVGGNVVESLVRSGVGELTLIDGDTVSESNLNRQIFATLSTVGLPKTVAAEKRIREINTDVKLNLVQRFILADELKNSENGINFDDFDYVVDAIDTVSAKIAIVEECEKKGVPVISAMGAGNKLDATKFEVTDIYKTSVCPLAAVMRRELRKRGIKKLKVVYSREEAVRPAFQPENSESRKTTPASCSFVPSVSGLIISGEVIKDICEREIKNSLDERRRNG